MYITNKTSSNVPRFRYTKTTDLLSGKYGPVNPKAPSSKLGYQAPTSSNNLLQGLANTKVGSGWSELGKGKSVNDLNAMAGKQGPVQSQSQPPKVSPGNSTSAVPEQVASTMSQPTPPPMTPPATTQTSTPPVSQTGKKGLVEPKVNPISFGGLVGSLAERSNASREQKRIQKALEQEAQANKAIGENARQLSEQYGKEIAQVGKLGAGAVAGNLSTGSNVVGSGNAAIASQSASQRMQALSQAQNAALAGTGQQLTAQGQAQTGLTSALGSANTQQQLGLSGLSSAAGLAAPSPAAYGQTVFDPTQGQFSGGNLDPQTQATNLAQQVMSGAMTYDQALASLGYAGSAGANFLNNAITGAGGNPLQLQATGVAQQGNITSAGTAGTDIARAGLMGATQQYVQMQTAAQTAHQQSAALLDIMNTANINGQPLIRVNKAWNQILQETSDPNIASYFAALEEARAAYSALLSTGGSAPTENDRKSIGILNGDSTPQATAAAIQQLEDAVARKLSSQYTAMQSYNQNLGSGSTGYGGGGFAEAW